MIKPAISYLTKATALVISASMLLFLFQFALAQTDDELKEIQDDIANRKTQIDQINKQIDSYREKLNQYASEAAGLANDVAMIENQVAITELDVTMTQVEIDTQQLELQVLDKQINDEIEKLNSQKGMLSEMVFTLNRKSDVGLIEVLFGGDDFNALFSEIAQLESVNSDLGNALEATKQTKAHLEENKASQQQHVDDLVDLESQLKEKLATLEQQRSAKDVLLAASQESEAKYKVLMSELRQERQFVTNEVNALQNQLDDKLAQIDTGESNFDPGSLSWPVNGGVITAIFHDPSYPFRNLFPHTGLDIAVPTGTSVKAAAPGIVAWARTGNSYGNYIMVIHPDGYATLYAHLSRLDVVADQYVARGEQIGLSGSTGLSTGPHLHFEVRLNGIPVDPQNYLLPR